MDKHNDIDTIENEKYHFVFMIDGSEYKAMYTYMLIDLKDYENVTFVIDEKEDSFLKKILLKKRVQGLVGSKLDRLYKKKNNLYNILNHLESTNKQIVVIFLNSALHYNNYLAGTLHSYKEKWSNLRLILLYLDIVGDLVSSNADYLRNKGIFDAIYTIDKKDSLKYKLIFHRTFYSADIHMRSFSPVRDIYFCGVSKNRGELIRECAEGALKHHVNCSMDIVSYENLENQNPPPCINFLKHDQYMSYPEVLHRELESKVLLEIVQKGQVALTLRPYEAVVYNRKLLTNNKSIFDFEFYDERYMRYFESPSNINWAWVKEDITVDYGYKGEFSPVNFLSDIIKNLEGVNCEN